VGCRLIVREFVKDVERGFRERGFAVENIYLSNRFNVNGVVRQRRAEGVRAVVYLDRRCQVCGLQVNTRL
jgi:hypothetical protein